MKKRSQIKKIIATVVLIIICSNGFAQQQTLDLLNQRRDIQVRNGLKALGSWSGANIIYGTIARNNSTGSTKYFHEMNAIFNSVTLGISALGFFSAKKPTTLNLSESFKKQNEAERLFLFNAGLDLAYVAGGAYLRERSKNNIDNSQRLKGYGNSVMLQGGVLALFDGVMYFIMQKNGKKMNALLKNISLENTGNSVGLIYRFD